jgi:hypothetical protein
VGYSCMRWRLLYVGYLLELYITIKVLLDGYDP